MRCLMLTSCLVLASLAEEPQAPPKVTKVIAERVAKLPPPAKPAVAKGVVMAISSADPRAQESVNHGMLCLQTGWDFEAYRHFCMALRTDPDCLMAHWGVAMALAHGHSDLQEARQAALDRMLALVDQGVGTELEKRYVFGLTKLITEGAPAAADAFIAAAREFPGDPQLTLLKCLLSRGGFDAAGEPTPAQLKAEEDLRRAIGKFPDLTWLRYAYLGIRAEGGSPEENLAMARQLAADAPEYPPYSHLLGHYEWRCGHHSRAAHAFGQAADLYSRWMRQNDLQTIDCPAWTKAETYRAVALASRGDYETALAVADALAAIEVPMERANSNGGRMLMWEARTLPVRILMRRDQPGDMARATKVLPPLDEVRDFGRKSLALWSYQFHSSLAAGRLALAKGERQAAGQIAEDITRIGENYVKIREVANHAGERSFWLRGFKAFEVMASEFRGLITMAGPASGRATAFNWYRSAADRQEHASLMMPPSVLLPMECRLAEHHLDRKQPAEAIKVLREGLVSYPNDFELLKRLQTACERGGLTEEAATIRNQLKALGGD